MRHIEVNKYQTPITEELLALYPEEIIEQLYDCLDNIPFIKNLISPNRRYAKDMPKDEKGRIIVDLENPHIIEDADYFRQPAIHFLEHQCYTFLKPNSNPRSEYRKFWEEELHRCREGYVRESDGEWVTGFCYWFLNYNPMIVNFIEEGKKKAIRKESMPFFFEGIYWRFHYLYKCREEGKHAIELAKRGAHPYTEKVFTPEGWKMWGDINIGNILYNTKGDEIKVINITSNGLMPVYEITLRDGRKVKCSDDHKWVVQIHNHKNIETLSTKELLKVYKKERPKSVRIPSGIEYTTKILKNEGVNLPFKKTKVDPYTFGLLLGDGCFRHKSCYYTQIQEDLEVEKQYIPYNITKWKSKYAYRINIPNWRNILKEYDLIDKKSEDKYIPEEFKYNSKEVRLNILRGLMDSDGGIHGGVPSISTTSIQLRDDIIEIGRSLGYNCAYIKNKAGYKINNDYKECLPSYEISIYADKEIFNLPRKQDKIHYNSSNALSRKNGTIITDIKYLGEDFCKCVEVDSQDSCYLIGDFITTHNCSKSYSLSSIMTHNLIIGEDEQQKTRRTTVLAAYQKEYLKDDKDGTFSKFRPSLNFIFQNTPFPNLMLKNSPNEMSWQMGYKDEFGRDRGSFNMVLGVSVKEDADKLRGKRGWILYEEMGTFAGLLATYDTTRRSVEEGGYTFAIQYLVGTANESESDFSSAKKLLQAPDGYNILSLNNVFDKPKQGSKKFGFFFPAYINRLGCYNHDGVSDVIKALLEILKARYEAKYNSADPTSVLRVIAEDPITPAEAIVKVKNAFFPIQLLNERLVQLDSNPEELDSIYVGDLVQTEAVPEFKITRDQPIRKFGEEPSSQGAIEIMKMPEKDKKTGEVFNNRYIIGVDPVDNDQAESTSLYSCFVFDLYTDEIVAEFTGRKNFAEDNFEITRKLCLYYNARCLYESNKKGIFAYFSKMQATHMLAPTPEYLREQGLIKYSAFGSNKYGVNANHAINNLANDYIRDWLLKTIEVYDKDNDTYIQVPQLFKIKNRALIEELIAFNPQINVDRIRALGMVMLYRQEKIIMYQGDMSKSKDTLTGSVDLANDKYFSRNYNRKKY